MAVHVVTGKLGSGKTLVSVSRIQERLAKGCPVATNLDLKLHNMPMVGRYAKKTRVIRIPDKPSLNDLLAIGIGIHLTMNPVMASLYLMNVVLGLIPAHGVIKTDNLLLTGFYMPEN